VPGHVALLLPDLRPGGTERLTLDLAEGFLARGISVDLVLCQQQGDFLSQVPEGARVIDLAAPRLRSVFGPLRRYLRQEQPQALIAAMWPLTSIAVWAAMGLSTRPRVVVSDHCPLSMQYAQRLGRVKLSMRASYRFAQGVVGVSQGLTSELAELAGIAPSRVTTIYNPVPRPALSGSDPDGLWLGRKGKRIVSVGSLKPEKNHKLLLDAVSRMAGEPLLALVGDGPECAMLEAEAARLGLAERTIFAGFSAFPGDWYAGADVMALTSDFEGFGNVQIEAMHFGLPVVATDCPTGPRDALGGGRWGQLVPCGDAPAFAAALARALECPVDGDAQRARAAEFATDLAVSAYLALALPGNSG
jgi:glycosyltransferase involved in cell wall biosynthesis